MLNWLLTKLTDHWEKKCKKQMGGIPLLWVIYDPDKPAPNITFKLHPMFNGDKALNDAFKGVAEYMREKYLEAETDNEVDCRYCQYFDLSKYWCNKFNKGVLPDECCHFGDSVKEE